MPHSRRWSSTVPDKLTPVFLWAIPGAVLAGISLIVAVWARKPANRPFPGGPSLFLNNCVGNFRGCPRQYPCGPVFPDEAMPSFLLPHRGLLKNPHSRHCERPEVARQSLPARRERIASPSARNDETRIKKTVALQINLILSP